MKQKINFEELINTALEHAKVPVSKVFIDKIEGKTFLRKVTVRTDKGEHFKTIIGKNELLTGFNFFVAILKSKYAYVLEHPKAEQKVKFKLHSGIRRTWSKKSR